MATLSKALSIALEHHRAGRLDAAEEIYRRILAVEPDHAEAWHLLGVIQTQQGDPSGAIECIARAIGRAPGEGAYHNSLGEAYRRLGRNRDAIDSFRQAIALQADLAAAYNNLGNALCGLGRLREAVGAYREALRLQPDSADACTNLGCALKNLGEVAEAIACHRRAVELAPGFAAAHSNLGRALQADGRLDEAVQCYAEALRLRPEFPEALVNLGNACKDQGRLDDALDCYGRAMQIQPGFVAAHSNLLYTLLFHPEADAVAICQAHRAWSRRHASALAGEIRPHGNDRSPDRRLRVGYVSPDFRHHAVGQFLLPLLETHDHRQLEVFCYSSVQRPDATTARCQAASDAWREASGLSDAELAELIRQDRIDILVDLTLHMEGSRLLVFARRPAPVQVTYLGYCGTTGLDMVDYRFSDPYMDPADTDPPIYAETTIRLPETYWCYRPIFEAPPPNVRSPSDHGGVTFGCLNNFCKVSRPAIDAWCRLLCAVPQSRLLLHAHPGSHRDRLKAIAAEHSIEPGRIEFSGYLPTADYFGLYQQIDVALDPFPYCGGTTTCDALWMGVPVVTLAGRTAVGRGGVSILSSMGLTELIAQDADAYVRVAAGLARDLPRLAKLRSTLRERMLASPLTDAPRFARHVEGAFRQMWRRWCATG